MGIQRKVALVTGAAKGIGRGICERLAADGLVIAAVDIEPSSDTVKSIIDVGGRAAMYICDVSKADQVNATVAAIARELGPVAVLVNNAGIHPNPPTMTKDMSDERWHQMVAVDLDSMFYFARACIPMMQEFKWGRIINFSSACFDGFTPPGATHYMTVKGGAVGLTRGLSTELGSDFITCNAIAPGTVDTPGLSEMDPTGSGMVLKAATASQLVQKITKPHNIAAAVSWLVSEEADMVTGQVIHIDGGVTRT